MHNFPGAIGFLSGPFSGSTGAARLGFICGFARDESMNDISSRILGSQPGMTKGETENDVATLH